MSTYSSIKRVEREIQKLNEKIDLRIVRGLSYKALSREHSILLAELRALKRSAVILSSKISWSKNLMVRFSKYASVFLM